jgi:primosomal protein N' (replication factor Y)
MSPSSALAQAGATVVLGSATPSLETRYNVERGKYQLLELPERVARRPMPIVDIVDMRQEFLETRTQNPFSRQLLDALRERLDASRADHAPAQPPRLCQFRHLPLLRRARRMPQLRRHPHPITSATAACSATTATTPPPSPTAARSATSDYLNFLGAGAEKVEDELYKALPRRPHRPHGPRHHHHQAAL